MKRLLVLCAALVIPALASALDAKNIGLWETAAFANKPGLTEVVLKGRNGAITTTFEAVWPESAAYTVLAADMSSPYVASTSANDTAAGTGARTVSVECVSAAGALTTTTYSLNGQTSVNLTQTCMVINKVEVLTAGSGGVNAGVIRVGTGANTAGAPAVVHAHVAAGVDVSEQFIYMVPTDYTLLCRNFLVGSLDTTAANAHRFALDRYVGLGILKREELISGETGGANPGVSPIIRRFAENTVLVGQALAATSTGPVILQAECLLISDEFALAYGL